MLKLRSISARLILAISLTVAVACSILGTFSIFQQRSLMRLALEQQLKLQYDSVIASVDYEGHTALAVSAVIAALPPVADAIAKGDRESLQALLGDAMAALKAQGVPLLTFQTLPALVFYRLHTPKVFGDDASARRKTVVEAMRTDRQIVGVEPGLESLGIFGMTPIKRDGKASRSPTSARPSARNSSIAPRRRFGIDLAVHWFDGKSFKQALLDLRRRSRRHPGRIEERFQRRGAASRRHARRPRRPRSISGRSRIMPANLSQ